jgi:tetratricopeptide (TPR) repeat protein
VKFFIVGTDLIASKQKEGQEGKNATKKNMMNRHLITTLLAMGSLIFLKASDVSAHEAKGKTIEEPVTLIRTFPQPNTDSGRVAEETPHRSLFPAKAYVDLGIMYSEKGEYELAISAFNKALEVDLVSAETFNNRGITYSQKGEYDLAISDFTKALEIKPVMAKAHYNRGITYAKKGEYVHALRDFDRSLELDSVHAPAYVNRGGLHAQLACLDWEKACQLGICSYLKKAVEIGLCIKTNENSDSSP